MAEPVGHNNIGGSNGSGAGPSMRATRKEGMRFAELWHIIKLKKRYPIVFSILMTLGMLTGRFTHIQTYTASSSLVLLEAKESASLAQVAGADILNAVSDDKRAEYDQLNKYVAYLRSSTFYLSLAEYLKFRPEYQKLNLTRPKELKIFSRKFWDHFYVTRIGGQKSIDYHDEKIEPVLIPVEHLAEILANLMKVEHDNERFMFIQATTLDPYTSMVIANSAAEVFNNTMRENDQNEITEIQQFVADRIKDTGERLKRDELELVAFRQRNNIISNMDNNLSASRLASVENELATSRLKQQETERLIRYYEEKLAERQKAIINGDPVVGRPDQNTSSLSQRLEDLRRQKFLLESQGYGQGHWRAAEIDSAIAKISTMLKTKLQSNQDDSNSIESMDSATIQAKLEQLKSANEVVKSKIEAAEKVRGELVQTMASLPAEQQKLVNLTNNVKLSFELYSNLKKRLQEIEIQRIALKARVKIEQLSGIPGPSPLPSLVAQLMFAALAGLFFGCIVIVVLEMLDSTVKHRTDLEDCELSVLGTVPKIESKIATLLGSDAFRPDLLICESQPESAEAMAFKYIRAQLSTMRGSDGKPAQSITITSADRSEGKSFIASNLAVSLAQLEKKVILLDCDFRNPSVHKYLGYENSDGLTSLLTMNAQLSDVVFGSKVPNLDIIPAGWPNPNPTELVCNEKFRILVKFLKSKYDYVIIDAPPASFVVDAPVMAGIADGVVLVASYRKTRRDALLMAHKKILQISHKRVHAVLNNVTEIHEFTTYYVMPYMSGSNGGKKIPYGAGSGPVDKASKEELAKFEENLGKKKSA